tara:strand:+ start:276 stop:1529 length:1254 start_codon:yes stop_codon:yes gene_type:complete
MNIQEKLKLEKSNLLYKKSFDNVPGGVLGVRRPYNFVQNEYPIFLDSSKGCFIKDVDGNEYLDMLAAYGPIIIGYREEEIDDAVIDQIKNKGFCMTLTQNTQNKLIDKLRNLIPSCEKAIIVKTGSDASTLAIRIARGFTNKDIILRCGYHGWHDWCVEEKGGIPKQSYQNVIDFEFNNLNSVEEKIIKYRDKIAAIITQPIWTPLVKEVEEPNKDYLSGLRKLADKHGIVLIFDEIRTGFRVDIGGAQKLYNVKPDLSVIGKAMANGYPISAVVGKRDIMNVASHKVFVSSTYFPNSFEQVAALRTIDFLTKNDVLNDIKTKGKYFSDRIIKIIEKSNVNCQFSGGPWMPFISFNKEKETINRQMRSIFYKYLVRSKIFLAPFHHGYIMYRHSYKDLDYVIQKIEDGLSFLNKNLK